MSKETEARTITLGISNLELPAIIDHITAGLIAKDKEKALNYINQLKQKTLELEENTKIAFND